MAIGALPPWPPQLRRYARGIVPVLQKGLGGILFDLDGVLIHTMPYHADAWQQTVREAGLRLSRSEVYQWEGEPGTATAKRLLERAGRRATAQAIRKLLDRKEWKFSHMSRHVEVESHWLEVLKTLHTRKVPMALVTGTSRGELHKLLERSFRDQFDVIVTGDQVQHGKPHPEPYQRAYCALGADAGRCIVIENAPYGIQSAQSAGVGCVVALTSSLPAHYLKEADVVVHRLDLLQRLLVYCSLIYWLGGAE
jgi:beta-phosphoglucomutase-like phosphatase (HAD superfamily)